MKKFSIITITWNNAQGLKRTLDSIRALQYDNKEVIIIDGASTDSTPDILKENADIIDIAVSEKDNGIYNAMNKGIRYVTGDYVVFMNAGDCFADSETLTIVDSYEGDILLGGEIYGNDCRMVKEQMTLYDVLSIGLNHQAVYYKTNIIKKFGFDEKYGLIADLKSVVEPMAKDKVCVTGIPRILAVCEGGGISKQRWRDTLTERHKIIEEVIDPYYRRDYLRFARINNSMLNDFILLSHFQSIFPIIRLMAKVMKFLNNRIKHVPIAME